MAAEVSSSSFLKALTISLENCLHSLNPSLLDSTPPFEELTGKDVCFLGPNGEDSADLVTYCKDVEFRSLVGSWYLTPERHALEMMLLPPLFVFVLWKSIPSLRLLEERNSASMMTYDHPRGIPILSVVCMSMLLVYKTLGQKLLYLCMPCNIQWALTVLLCFGNLSGPSQGLLKQFILCFSGYTVVALATPDTSDCLYFGEAAFFFFNHTVLLAIPILYLVTRRISVFSPSKSCSTLWFNMQWWLASCAAFGIFYFLPVTLVAIFSGQNLNYMMSPPPGQDVVVGNSYRLLSIGCCALLIGLTRISMVMGEYMCVLVSRLIKTKQG
jgi:hypothetical protein